jgi:molybdopterin synthase catalytic subunit
LKYRVAFWLRLKLNQKMRIDTDFFELTRTPLDVGAIVRRVVPPECGATVVLDGYVRRWTSGKETLHLVYEAFEPMALAEMKKLSAGAREQFEIAHIGIVHRLGKLEIGETSIVVAVAAPHRKAAFAACEWLIRGLKRRVPIWKKEFYAGGSAWVEDDTPTPFV